MATATRTTYGQVLFLETRVMLPGLIQAILAVACTLMLIAIRCAVYFGFEVYVLAVFSSA